MNPADPVRIRKGSSELLLVVFTYFTTVTLKKRGRHAHTCRPLLRPLIVREDHGGNLSLNLHSYLRDLVMLKSGYAVTDTSF